MRERELVLPREEHMIVCLVPHIKPLRQTYKQHYMDSTGYVWKFMCICKYIYACISNQQQLMKNEAMHLKGT